MAQTEVTQKLFRILSSDAEPATPNTGDFYIMTDTGTLKVWDGAAWSSVGSGGSAVAEGRPKTGATRLGVIPNVAPVNVNTFGFSKNTDYYFPILVPTAVTVANIFAEITTAAGVGGSKGRFAIFSADTDMQPSTRKIDTGEFAIDAITALTIACAVALTAGRYLVALNIQENATFRVIRSMGYMGMNPSLGTSPFTRTLTVARAYAAFPDPGTAWTAVAYAANGMEVPFALDLSTP